MHSSILRNSSRFLHSDSLLQNTYKYCFKGEKESLKKILKSFYLPGCPSHGTQNQILVQEAILSLGWALALH